MAIYHFSAQVISRSRGKSAVASASYRSAEKLHDERIGETFDYTRKQNVSATEIHAPDHAPDWVRDRGRLWNAVEIAEKRKDAQLAREINLALPTELTTEQNSALVQKFVRDNFVSQGMVADVAYHDLQSHNPHAHIMLTTREITPEGFGKKNREWNQTTLLQQWREGWAKSTNRALEIAGTQQRIDHRSLEEQGINRLPEIHVGVHANAMARRGLESSRHRRNEAIKVINLEKARLEKEEKELQQLLEKPLPKDQRTTLANRLEDIRQNNAPAKQQEEKTRTYADMMKEHAELEKNFNQARNAYATRERILRDLRKEAQQVQEKIKRYNDSVKRMNDLETKVKQINPLNPFKRAERQRFKRDLEIEQKYHAQLIAMDKPEGLVHQQDQILSKMQVEETMVSRLGMIRDEHKQRFAPVDRERNEWQQRLNLEQAKDSLSKFNRGEKLKLPEAKNLLKHAPQLQLDTLATRAIKGLIRVMDQDRNR